MAALCPGVQYGLSSQRNFSENKDLIFVKLTDSALRAIEEYIKNQNKLSCSPTIKFLGNEGQLSFPSLHSGYASFNFSMSSTADMEGPGGSFECMQQSAPPRSSLEAFGPIPHKMRILANDDIYEATRHRMTVAEENHKNKCTREIKPNQTDIGRKVKVKQSPGPPGRPVGPIRKETPPRRDVPVVPPKAPHYPNATSVVAKPPVSSPNNGLVNSLGNTYISSSRSPNKPSIPDIARRPIKERLIQLLAMRPFKKPELYERLQREGLRERSSMSSVLKQIATLRDNAFHLNRAMWNDVREDWPFYTESERAALKWRKPQNLTPPGSSDGGSSGSGQSPTSTHPGSPPPISSSKRPGYYDGADGILTKRPRISHYRKPSEQTYKSPVENSQRRPVTDSRDASNMNPRSREMTGFINSHNGYSNTVREVVCYNNLMLNEKHNGVSDDDDGGGISPITTVIDRKRSSCDSHNSLGGGVNRRRALLESNSNGMSPDTQDSVGYKRGFIDDRPAPLNGEDLLTNGWSSTAAAHRQPQDRTWNRVSSTTQSNPSSPVEPQVTSTDAGTPNVADSTVDPEFPDYRIEYTPIENIEQRRRYKANFNADYAEYRDLHAVVEKVSRRFADLEEKLKQETTTSIRYKDLRKQIYREYTQSKQDLEHQKAKRRFEYLHDKLSHIKRLVFEYDQNMTKNGY